MATITRKSTVPYYCVAAFWVLYGIFFPLYRVTQFVAVGIISAILFFIMKALCKDVVEEVPDKPKTEVSTGNADLDKMLKEGQLAMDEMQRLDDTIADEEISADIQRLKTVSGKIFEQIKADPSKLPQIRKFMDYYLPTTLKLLNAYDRMGAQGVEGENINSTMSRVEDMMKTIVTAFEKQLDSLFGAEALDISTDITVLEAMMAREGLTEQEMKAETVENVDIGDIKLEF